MYSFSLCAICPSPQSASPLGLYQSRSAGDLFPARGIPDVVFVISRSLFLFPLGRRSGFCVLVALSHLHQKVPVWEMTCRGYFTIYGGFLQRKMFFLSLSVFIFIFLAFFRAAPAAYGGSQARGRIGTAAAGLYHSQSNERSEVCLPPTPQLMATLDP